MLLVGPTSGNLGVCLRKSHPPQVSHSLRIWHVLWSVTAALFTLPSDIAKYASVKKVNFRHNKNSALC